MRNRAILAMLIGCCLRRAEVVTVAVEDFELREDHWGLADLIGKGGHMRTVPVPVWVKAAVDVWMSSAKLQSGVLFRPVDKTGKVRGSSFTAKVIWSIVRKAGTDCGFGTVAPHGLRRTCTRLCHQAGGELEQIQFLLGARVRPDHRTLPGVQAAAPKRRQRPDQAGTGLSLTGVAPHCPTSQDSSGAV